MTAYSQDTRPMRIETVLGPDQLLLTGFSGQEGVSRPFVYQIDLVADQATSIDPVELLSTSATLTLVLKDGSERRINGLIRRFSQHGSDGKLARYRIELVPWLWFLSLTRDCRIFQEMTVPEILADVFQKQGFTDFDDRCTGSYDKREYCVQYRETNLNFASRLMEEEGIFYFFEHEDDKHTLVLADSNSAVASCSTSAARVAPQEFGTEDVIKDLQADHAVYLGKVTLAEHDYLQPSLTLRRSLEGDGEGEAYDYMAVGFTKMDKGDRFARIQLEAEEAMHQIIRGASSCRFLESGFQVEVEDHYRPAVNQAYMLLEVHHRAAAQEFRSTGAAGHEYSNEFMAIPSSVPYRPLRRAEKPTVRGSQTAVVVGKSGEEIWVDKHGRVKVQFHWDRQGQKDENSSCWVRVSSGWAGKGWGMVQIPRIGQEVLVDFIEGDPDRPVIVGRLYNAEQTPPYTLPDNGTQSGVKSRSSKSGGTEDFNEIRFEDKKGSEEFYEHAQKDMKVVVENDRNEEVGQHETIKIAKNRTEEVGENENIKIGKNRTEEVGENEKVEVKKARAVKVGDNDELKVDKALTVTVNKDITIKSSTSKITMQATQEIELKVAGSSIKITPQGIELKAPQIKIQGDAQVEVKGPMVKAQADAMLQLKGAIAQINGDGMLKMQGGITMIN